jgi:hypothetical protein
LLSVLGVTSDLLHYYSAKTNKAERAGLRGVPAWAEQIDGLPLTKEVTE